ncbi:Excreted virulence factor EspC, type VII ESX diderm [Lentzea xinjiangensis]|uniref:Excreted virulence factor EspC, type VII ESX diderm n=1 Tax=Lentzea xinjiangensis TaxID=402600 RepID=A0A1H9G4Y0_9PSEU|nr:type VII secretion target [Lentzea xinjiangensis]SEQ45206.1 Excreted virulence factor EspC, type VII ESX diderm [Lentzea xinjiangensis]
MTSGGFHVTSDVLEAHAKALEGLQGRLQGAVDAANTVSMPTDAYGIICQPFRMLLDPVEQWGMDALKGVSEAMSATAKKVTETAKHYQEVEDQIANTLKGGF